MIIKLYSASNVKHGGIILKVIYQVLFAEVGGSANL